MDLVLFATGVDKRIADWGDLGIDSEFLPPGETRAQREKWAAEVRLHGRSVGGHLTVWASGEAELEVVYVSDSMLYARHYDLIDEGVSDCLDDLTQLMTHRPPPESLRPA
jgi:hypothetical protein